MHALRMRPEPTLDLILLFKAAIMGVVEGLTEFLPVSSTGHLILTGSLLGLTDDKSKVFDIAIQTGAILAVIIVYWQRLSTAVMGLGSSERARRFVLNVFIGFLPAAVIGFFVYKAIKKFLFNGPVVAAAFIVGGIIILWVEKRANPAPPRITDVDEMKPMDALKVGFVQCLGMIPGTSRSGATIIGGMLLGLSRKAATDFSFFLAIPTLIAAGGYSLWKERALLSMADLPMFAVGFFVSFFAAWVCVRWLLRYISTHTFVVFAWYRIAFGIVVLITAYSGLVTWAD
jgi:undecaprenyl-diphosphatase